jgi:hypothetical protein
MLTKVQRSKEKKRKKRKKKRRRKRKKIEKNRRIKCSLVLFGFINSLGTLKELFHTQIFQPCAIR